MKLGLYLLLWGWILAATPARAVIVESGKFYDEVLRLQDLAFAKNSGDYVAPTTQQRSDFRGLATSLYDHDWTTADSRAAALGYDLVQFTNTTTNAVYWGVREQLVNGEQTRGYRESGAAPYT